jgi:hypothetical protein
MGNQQPSYKEESMIVTKHALYISAAAVHAAGAVIGYPSLLATAAASRAAGADVEDAARVITVNRRPPNHY